MRDASSKRQPAHPDKTISASCNGNVEGVNILVDLKPRRPSSNAEKRTVRVQDESIET